MELSSGTQHTRESSLVSFQKNLETRKETSIRVTGERKFILPFSHLLNNQLSRQTAEGYFIQDIKIFNRK
jgi:hypothetical protein